MDLPDHEVWEDSSATEPFSWLVFDDLCCLPIFFSELLLYHQLSARCYPMHPLDFAIYSLLSVLHSDLAYLLTTPSDAFLEYTCFQSWASSNCFCLSSETCSACFGGRSGMFWTAGHRSCCRQSHDGSVRLILLLGFLCLLLDLFLFEMSLILYDQVFSECHHTGHLLAIQYHTHAYYTHCWSYSWPISYY